MARPLTRQLSRWYVRRYPATTRRPARAVVILHGHEYGVLTRQYVSETYTVPLPAAPATNEQLVAAVMRLSTHKWAAAAYVFGDIRKALKKPSVLATPQMLPADPDDALPAEALAQQDAMPASMPVVTPGMARPSLADQAAARAAFAADHAERMSLLSGPASDLHTPGGVAVLAALDVVGLLLAFVLNFPLILLIVLAGLCLLDWHNTISLHGSLSWTLLRATHPKGFWWAVAGMVLIGWVALPSIYAVQAWLAIPQLRAAQRAATQARIAELEAELLPTPATPASEAH